MTTSITTLLTYAPQAHDAATLYPMLSSRNRMKSGRAMQAMMGMRKLDLAKLQAAFEGA